MATNKAKTTAKKSTIATNVNRIQKTAKQINSEVSKTTGEVIDNVVENGKELRTLATKTVKEAGKKLDLNKSIEMIRKTTISVNDQVLKTAEEVIGDVTATGKEYVNMATKKAKEVIENVDINEQFGKVKTTAKKANKIALETADNLVDVTFENSEKWHNVAEKAVKGGLKLANRQQELVFDTLETVKGQLVESAGRVRKLFSNN